MTGQDHDLPEDPAALAASAVRRIIEQLVQADAAASGDEAWVAALRSLEAAERALGGMELVPWHQRADRSDVEPSAAFSRVSPVRGDHNPLAPPLRLDPVEVPSDSQDEELPVLRGSVTFGLAYEGPAGCVHGGFLAATFDSMLGRVVAQLGPGRSGFTGRLTVRYRHPVPLGVPLRFVARVDRDRGRMMIASASCFAAEDPARILAEADGLFVRPRPRLAGEE